MDQRFTVAVADAILATIARNQRLTISFFGNTNRIETLELYVRKGDITAKAKPGMTGHIRFE